MIRYIARRVALAVLALVGVSLVVFVLSLASGDVTPPGPGQPVWVRFPLFLWNLLRGDFGQSIHFQHPALQVVGNVLPATLELVLPAFAVTLVLGLVLGMLAARRRGGVVDWLVRASVLWGQSLASFWLGAVLLLLAMAWHWLPAGGKPGIASLILPVVALAAFPLASVTRITRAAAIASLESEPVRVLRASGVSERTILWTHVLRATVIPLVRLAGVQLGLLVGGALVVETMFAWPGIGSLMVDAVGFRDYPVIAACVLLASILLIVVNLVADLLLVLVDPRIPHG